MAAVDRLSLLPSELRSYIYSFLLSDTEYSTVPIGRHREWDDDPTVPSLAKLCKQHAYVAYRTRTPGRADLRLWPDHLERAFMKALHFVGPEPRERGEPSRDAMITQIIHRLTGELRSPKRVKDHLTKLRGYLAPKDSKSKRILVQKHRILGNSALSSTSHTKDTWNVLSLLWINRLMRQEASPYIFSNCVFDVGVDLLALDNFLNNIDLDNRELVRFIRLEAFSETVPKEMDPLRPYLANKLPNLQTVYAVSALRADHAYFPFDQDSGGVTIKRLMKAKLVLGLIYTRDFYPYKQRYDPQRTKQLDSNESDARIW